MLDGHARHNSAGGGTTFGQRQYDVSKHRTLCELWLLRLATDDTVTRGVHQVTQTQQPFELRHVLPME
jgi:hypothetical protein